MEPAAERPAPARILAVSLRYPPYVAGGYEGMMHDVCVGLRERGHAVEVLCGRGRRFDGRPHVLPRLEPDLDAQQDLFARAHAASNAERFRLHFFRLSNWRATGAALRATGAECLFFFNLGLASLAPVLAARHAGVPTLGYVCDPWLENHWLRDWRADPQGARAKPLRLRALARAWDVFRDLALSGPLVFPSEWLRARAAASGAAVGDQPVIPNALSPAMERLAARAERPARRAAGERLRVVCTSMHWEGKGIHVLLEAARRAARAGVDLEVFLAGDGGAEYRRRLEQLAAAPELAGRVTFGGRLDREALSDRLLASHVFVLPSVWGEPFGLATLEAMAHGLAVVGTDSGATPELLARGAAGLLVPTGDADGLADALERLAADEERRLALGAAARERVAREYRHDELLDRLERALGDAMGLGVA